MKLNGFRSQKELMAESEHKANICNTLNGRTEVASQSWRFTWLQTKHPSHLDHCSPP